MKNGNWAVDWAVRDVLVGVLHNEQQLEANFAHRFYHIPAALLTCPPEKVAAVALYQSTRLFGEGVSGIRVWGPVKSFAVLPRREITEIPARQNGDEPYCRFQIGEWEQLPNRIKARGLSPGVSMMTNQFLLQHSRYFPELYIRTEEQLLLYTTLRRAAARTARNGGSELLWARDGNTVMIAGHTIGIYTGDGRYEERDLRNFFHQPLSFLTQLSKIMFK